MVKLKDVTLSTIQKEVDEWARQFTKPYFSPLSQVLCMQEELGEVSRVINDMYGDKKKKKEENLKELEEELGDLLFTIICMANSQNIDLNQAYERKMNKVKTRDNDRFEKR